MAYERRRLSAYYLSVDWKPKEIDTVSGGVEKKKTKSAGDAAACGACGLLRRH